MRKIICLLALFILWSCEHDNIKEKLGPDLLNTKLVCPTADFKFIDEEIADTLLDFSVKNLAYSLPVNEKVFYDYGFIGTNGARFQAGDFKNEIAINWDGGTNVSKFFKTGDKVKMFYLINCQDTLWSRNTYRIIKPKKPAGLLFSDFDGDGYIKDNGGDVGWKLLPSASNGVINAKDFIVAGDCPQGEKYLSLRGTRTKDSFIGQVSTANFKNDFLKDYSFDQLYFNIYVRSDNPLGAVEIRLAQGSENQLSYTIKTDFIGWKLFSIPTKDFFTKGTLSPATMSTIRMVLRSDDTEPVNIDIDYMSFTIGGPIIP